MNDDGITASETEICDVSSHKYLGYEIKIGKDNRIVELRQRMTLV